MQNPHFSDSRRLISNQPYTSASSGQPYAFASSGQPYTCASPEQLYVCSTRGPPDVCASQGRPDVCSTQRQCYVGVSQEQKVQTKRKIQLSQGVLEVIEQDEYVLLNTGRPRPHVAR